MPFPAHHRLRGTAPWLAVVATGALLLALAPPVVPSPHQFAGDPGLAAAALPAAAGHEGALAMAVVDSSGTRLAGRGAGPEDAFEIGSLTKTFNGMLLADAVERGEVTLDTTLGETLDLGEVPAATVTLGELATHTSGLPRLPASAGFMVGSLASTYLKSNPYTQSVETLIGYAGTAGLSDRGEYAYSNFGAALLGQALARRAGVSYPELVSERITIPLGMTRTWVAPLRGMPADARFGTAPAESGTALQGHSPSGYRSAPWPGDGFAPAGAIRSSSADLARLATALLDETAPGMASIDLQERSDTHQRTGLFWHLGVADDGSELVQHSGMTGGFAAFIALDPAGKRAVVVLGNHADSTSGIGIELLKHQGRKESP